MTVSFPMNDSKGRDRDPPGVDGAAPQRQDQVQCRPCLHTTGIEFSLLPFMGKNDCHMNEQARKFTNSILKRRLAFQSPTYPETWHVLHQTNSNRVYFHGVKWFLDQLS